MQPAAVTPTYKPFYRRLSVQIIAALIAGILIGHFFPETATGLKPLGDAFIKTIKMVIGPVIFCTIVGSLSSLENLSSAGRIGIKAFIYFLILSTISLAIGYAVAHLFQPGAGMNIDAGSLDTDLLKPFLKQVAATDSFSAFLLHIIPVSPVSAFAEANILQILFFSILFAIGAGMIGDRAAPVLRIIDDLAQVFFSIIAILMKFAPLGVLGAMAYTVGAFGIASVIPLAKLMGCFYLTCILFIFIILAVLMRWTGLNIFHLIRYLKEELLIVFGTSSSETALPRLMEKLRRLGCDKTVVGIVVPTGYSFNLDGTAIYLSMAAIFLSQATNTPLSTSEELLLLGVLMISSKGAAGVTGSGFITLTATLASVGHIPVSAAVLILGIDRFMSEARALTNFIGNAVATLFIAKIEGGLQIDSARKILSGSTDTNT